MKISNSKKQLAKIISENGGWRDDAEWAVFGTKSMHVAFIHKNDGYPVYSPSRKAWPVTPSHVVGEFKSTPFANWHQTILPRDEYFHLYPATDAVSTLAEEPEHIWTNPPTIEQLAADYRAKLAIVQQAQEEADSHRCGAEAALEKLVAAGKALGLVLSVSAPEPELVITDWRDLRVGDDVEYLAGKRPEMVGEIRAVVGFDANCPHGLHVDLGCNVWPREWRFIRRPAKGDANA